MTKKTKELILFLALGPLWPSPAAAITAVSGTSSNAYMVENTSGTSPSGTVCYDFQTRPTCNSFIAGLSSGSIPSGSTNYIQNTATPTTATQIFNVSSGAVTGNFTTSSETVNNTLTGLGKIRANNFDSSGSATPNNGFTQSAANTVTFYTGGAAGLAIGSNQVVSFPVAFTSSSGTVANLAVTTITYSDGTTQTSAGTTLAAILATTNTWTASQTFSQNVTVSTLTFSTGGTQKWASLFIQRQCFTISTSSSTTAVTQVPSNIKVTITPKVTGSSITINTTFMALSTIGGSFCNIDLYRGTSGTPLTTSLSATNLFATIGGSLSTVKSRVPIYFSDLHGIAAGTAIQYTVSFASSDTNTVTLNNGQVSTICAEEYAPVP